MNTVASSALRRRTAAFVLVVCALAGLGVVTLMRAPSTEAGAAAPVDPQSAGEPAPPTPTPSPALLPVRTAVESAVPSPRVHDGFEVLDTALRASPKYVPGDDSAYLARYEGLSLEQLQVAEFVLHNRMNEERNRILEQRAGAGLSEVRVVREGEPAAPLDDPSDSAPIRSFGVSFEPGDGVTTIRTTSIPAEEYPEFRDLQMEVWWLASRLRHLGRPLLGGS